MSGLHKKYLQLTLLALLILGANILMYTVGPAAITELIGVENTYVLVFVLAFFGTVSAVAAPFFYSFLAAISFGGLNPILLGVTAALGLFLGDSLFYHMVELGRWSASKWYKEYFHSLKQWGSGISHATVQIVTYLYFGFTPLPNDLLMVVLAAIGYRYRQVALSMFLGDLTIAMLVAHFGRLWV